MKKEAALEKKKILLEKKEAAKKKKEELKKRKEAATPRKHAKTDVSKDDKKTSGKRTNSFVDRCVYTSIFLSPPFLLSFFHSPPLDHPMIYQLLILLIIDS